MWLLWKAREAAICGICGIIDFGGDSGAERLDAMTDALTHRGPDSRGTWSDGIAALGHRRLAIIDLTPTGHQPMGSGSVTMVFNGEIYNFEALREELVSSGVRFRGRSDSEVLLEGFRAWGNDLFGRLNGMFAVALWDDDARRLTLARDRFGQKPLYIAQVGGGLIFGSEIKALFASGRVSPALDPVGLHEYLWYGTTLGTTTLFEGVKRLEAGSAMTLDASGVRTWSWWAPTDVAQLRSTPDEAARGVRERLSAAVERHLVSDVPVGVFLSGGIDSSAITMLAARQLGRGLRSYSVGFDFDTVADELPRARRVAEAAGSEHHELRVSASDLPRLMAALVRAHDQPFGDVANLPLYLLCAELDDAKVVLQGDGGDEFFAGYRRYEVLRYERRWRAMARLGHGIGRRLPLGARGRRGLRFLRALREPDRALRYAALLTSESLDHSPVRVLTPELRERVQDSDPFARYRVEQGRVRHLDALQQMLYIDTRILLPDTFLEKVDRPTMAHGIEIRAPFLDTELTDYAMGLPSHLKVARGQSKTLLRAALRGLVPDEVLDSPKQGFSVPYADWLRGPLLPLLQESVMSCSLLDRGATARVINEHVRGQQNHGYVLYKLLQLAVWHREYLEN